MLTRKDILEKADKCVNGDRDESYGSPEESFDAIAKFWRDYIVSKWVQYIPLTAKDVAAMMSLFKIARVATGNYKSDNWIDLAGYAACGGEIESREEEDKSGKCSELGQFSGDMASFSKGFNSFATELKRVIF